MTPPDTSFLAKVIKAVGAQRILQNMGFVTSPSVLAKIHESLEALDARPGDTLDRGFTRELTATKPLIGVAYTTYKSKGFLGLLNNYEALTNFR